MGDLKAWKAVNHLINAPEPDSLIHEAITSHAVNRPDATALISGGQYVSYKVLDEAANGYAADLAERGVGKGMIVPILIPRSPQIVALQLAILKCGAAYTNLDPQWPTGLLAEILGRISPPVAVSGSDIDVDRIPIYRPPELGLSVIAAKAGAFSPSVTASASSPATVFFTSGTTGKAKGIIASHRAVTRLFRPTGLEGFGPGHVMPQAASPQWDMYAFELWGQLTSGGTVVLVDGKYLLPDTLRDLVQTAGISTMWITTSLFNLFVDEDPECFRGLCRLFVGGEALSSAHIQIFLDRHPGIVLRNGYGPAENCMLTSIHDIRRQDCHITNGIPIGLPVQGTRIVLLDGDGQQCPVGEVGEICAAGSGLAIGYLDDPSLTREKFPHIFIDGSLVRIYRTGDMGLVDERGLLHFRGRYDRQVKLHGHRIELTELEGAARALDSVHDCAAVPIHSKDGVLERIGLVYLVKGPIQGMATSRSDPLAVRRQLRDKLPAYAVPTIVRFLPSFPVTANGKLDRGALERSLTKLTNGDPS